MDDKIIGFKDMHSAQVEEFMNFVAHALDISSTLADSVNEEGIFEETKSKVESLIEMFGGHAVIDQTSHVWSDLEQG